MAWFKKVRKPIEPPDQQSRVPEGLWVKCPSCGQVIYNKDLAASLERLHEVRPSLPTLRNRAAPLAVRRRLGGARPRAGVHRPAHLHRYQGLSQAARSRDRVDRPQGRRHHGDRRRSTAIETVVSAMEYGFIGGSMGVVVGEKITRGIERAIARKLPVIIVSCSGGARMMEGALSLMQMAKISSALARLDRARLPYISLLTDPTTGGVTASFAMLGDLNIAEPKALIGFAGPRVIEQTIRQTLPEGFQRSEFLLERGMLDIVVDRRELKDVITRVLRFAPRGRNLARRPAVTARAGSVAVAPPAPMAPLQPNPVEQSG